MTTRLVSMEKIAGAGSNMYGRTPARKIESIDTKVNFLEKG
jgi:hypothetical protein